MTSLPVGEVVSDRSLSRPALKFASGELVFGYRLIRPLGKGSFGEVWLATNDKGFEWALKIVSLAGSGGKKEFRALQLIKDRKIKSTHLLKLIDYGCSIGTAPVLPSRRLRSPPPESFRWRPRSSCVGHSFPMSQLTRPPGLRSSKSLLAIPSRMN
jgi:hypothetical protein